MHAMDPTAAAGIPTHVRPEQVFDFDLYFDEGLLTDIHQGYRDLQGKAPAIFYTLRNGGHWVVTRGDLVAQVMKDAATFSSVEIDIPRSNNPHRQIPINLDPPEHGPYRKVLMKYFTPRVVAGLHESMKRWANVVINRAYENGHCYFTEHLGAAFPVYVFMEMCGLPFERFAEFRSIVTEFFTHLPIERRVELSSIISEVMGSLVDARTADPKDDLMSKLLNEEVQGRKLTREELVSIGFLLFVAGLDTVANMMSFMFHFLAQRSDLQELLANDESKVAPFVDEVLRRFPIVTLARVTTTDIEIAGAQIKAGDMMHAPLPLYNLDDRQYPNAMEFDMSRASRDHLTFSTGPHLCLGHGLARAELQLFVKEFLKRIPRFRLPQGFKPRYRPGIIMALENLELEWDVERAIA